MYSRKRALALAKQYRTCPPIPIRSDPSQKAGMRRHRAICPYCADDSPAQDDAWYGLADSIEGRLSTGPGKTRRIRPMPGQIRAIRADLARWREDRYYNPPAVMILHAIPDLPDALSVAQVYHDDALAGPGDLMLTERQTGFADLFIETWNTYTLKAAYLGPVLGRVGPDIVRAVKALEEDSDDYPVWAPHPIPFQDEDPRLYFRELEVEAGYTFASAAADEIVSEMEESGVRLIYRSPEEAQDVVRRVVSRSRWDFAPQTAEEAIAFARLPTEMLPLAAADEDESAVSAKAALIGSGEIVDIVPVSVEILHDRGLPGAREMSGRIRGLPRGTRIRAVAWFLQAEGRRPLPAAECRWDEAGGSIFARFRGKGLAPMKPVVTFFCEQEERKGTDA